MFSAEKLSRNYHAPRPLLVEHGGGLALDPIPAEHLTDEERKALLVRGLTHSLTLDSSLPHVRERVTRLVGGVT